MFRLIYRQRRRLLLGSFFGTLGIMMTVFHRFNMDSLNEVSLPLALSALLLLGLLLGSAIIAVSVIWVVLLPNARTMVELVGIAAFVNAVIAITLPQVLMIPYVSALAPLLLGGMIYAFVYGGLLDRFRLWVDYKTTRSFVSPKSVEELWEELVPGEAPLRRHWDNMLYALERDQDDPETLDAQYIQDIHDEFNIEHQTMTFLDREAPYYARYHHVGDINPRTHSLVEGIYEIRIEADLDGGSKVTLSQSRRLIPHQIALSLWLDDHLGDQTDYLLARHLNRKDWSQAGRSRRRAHSHA